jgi:serine/threonine-protein kinase
MDPPPPENTPSPLRHQLLLELGRGGMGTVYLAVSRGVGGFNKLKVVKQLRPELATDESFLKMFLDEARLSARLNHPNIVQTNEVGFDGTHSFIEMEYLSLAASQVADPKAGAIFAWYVHATHWVRHEHHEQQRTHRRPG